MEARIQKYLDKCPPAISGQGGHNRTFAVACALTHGFALSVTEALPYLQAYNERCRPSWSHKELMHKLTDAAKRSDRRGHSYLNTQPRRKRQTVRRPIQAPTVKSPRWAGRNAL